MKTLLINRSYSSYTRKTRISLINLIKKRLASKRDIRIIISGEPGSGKSTLALNIASLIDKSYVDDYKRSVEVKVCFKGLDYLNAVRSEPENSVLILDESGQAIHHREFMQEANIILSKTLIGNRFKRFVQIFCIPNLDMLDKDARGLAQLLFHIPKVGVATVYRITPARLEGKTWYKKLIDNYTFGKPDIKLWRAYEKKKFDAQEELYATFIKVMEASNTPDKTNADYVVDILKNPDRYMKNDKWSNPKIRTLGIGRERAETIREMLNDKEITQLIR